MRAMAKYIELLLRSPRRLPERLVAVWIYVVILTMSGYACGPRQATTGVPAATVDVRNVCPERMEVFANGQLLGRIDSGTYQRFGGLLSGAIRLDAYAMHGDRVLTVQPELTAGGTFVWELVPADASVAVAAPRGLGRIEVENRLPHDLDISIDNEPRARVLAGETRVLDSIPEGDRNILAHSKLRHLSFQHRGVVPTNDVLRWIVDDDHSELTIVNKSSEPMILTVDLGKSERLEPGKQTTVGHLLGTSHTIEAMGLQSGRKYKKTVEIAADEKRTVELAGSDSSIRVVNETNDNLVIRLDELDIGRVEPMSSSNFTQISQGNRILTATAVRSGQQFQTPAQLFSEQTFVWYVSANAAALWVANLTDENVAIYMDEAQLTTLEPGESRYISQLNPGNHLVEAIGEQSRIIQSKELKLAPERAAQWTISSLLASIELRNNRKETLRVFVDADYLAEIPPGTTLTIDGLIPGDRLFEAWGKTSFRTTRTRMSLTENQRAAWEIVEGSATVKVTNLTQEMLEIDRFLANAGDTLGPGETAQYTIATGDWRITLLGMKSQHSFVRRVTANDGDTVEWKVEPLMGDLIVHNRRLEPVRVHIDDIDVGILAGDSSQTFHGLNQGPHEVSATSESGFVSRGKLNINADKPTNWEVHHETAGLQVVNTTYEELALFVDGRPYGVIVPGESRLFGRIPAGTHTVSSFGKRTGRHYEVAMTFHEDEVARWTVEAQRTVARIHNRRTEAARVFVDGKHMIDVLPGTVGEVLVEAGPRHIDIHGVVSLDSKPYVLTVASDQSYDFDFTELTSKVVVENQAGIPLRIHLDGHPVGHLPPNEKLELAKISAGRVLLEATAEGLDNQRWQRRLTLRNGHDEVWTVTGSRNE